MISNVGNVAPMQSFYLEPLMISRTEPLTIAVPTTVQLRRQSQRAFKMRSVGPCLTFLNGPQGRWLALCSYPACLQNDFWFLSSIFQLLEVHSVLPTLFQIPFKPILAYHLGSLLRS